MITQKNLVILTILATPPPPAQFPLIPTKSKLTESWIVYEMTGISSVYPLLNVQIIDYYYSILIIIRFHSML